MENKVIIAHRGASVYEEDNTLESFEKAVEMGADSVEFDIRRTSDDVFIAFHDSKLYGRLIKDTSYDELNRLAMKRGFKILRVEDVVRACGKDVSFDVHLKEAYLGLDTAALMKDLVGESRFFITSEHMDALLDLRKKYSKLKLGYIVLRENPFKFITKFVKLRLFPGKFVKDLRRKKIDYIVPNYLFVGNRMLKEVEKAGIKVLPWTLNNRRVIDKFLKMDGVYGITTDKLNLVDVKQKSLEKLVIDS